MKNVPGAVPRKIRCLFFLTLVLELALPVLSNPPDRQVPGCFCLGTVGNVDCDYADQVTVADLALLIDHLYISGARLPNLEEANADGDPAGRISLSDVAVLIDHLFISKQPLPPCPEPVNHPPDTRITGVNGTIPFMNAVAPGVPTAGVFLCWIGQDLIDHPYYPPGFDFEYRLYGPYTESQLSQLRSSFMPVVFQTADGDILRTGLPPDTVRCDTVPNGSGQDTIICLTLRTNYIHCDTTWDGGVREITCDTVLIDTLHSSTSYLRMDTLFDVTAPAFVSDPQLNRVAAASSGPAGSWTLQTSDTLYNLFACCPSDTTRQAKFVFWVRTRDPMDSTLYDPTPDFRVLDVIDPRFEREILIVDWTTQAAENRVLSTYCAPFWTDAVASWTSSRGLTGEVDFDPGRDILPVSSLNQGYAMLRLAVRYKVLISLQDASISGGWSNASSPRQQIFAAIASGANAWVATRVPLGLHAFGSPVSSSLAPEDYAYFFGTVRSVYSGWSQSFFVEDDGFGFGRPRTEDFVGAWPEEPTTWPELTIDTARLHGRYDWQGSIEPPVFPFYPYLPEIGALPEVGWAEPTADAEILYRYHSLYGPVHPIYPELSFEGFPVMHRLDRGAFRTIHANFTPLSLESTCAQGLVDAVLDWLLLPRMPGGSRLSVNDNRVASDSDFDVRRWYLDWRNRNADGDGRDSVRGPQGWQ
jgi:hypothetical protein